MKIEIVGARTLSEEECRRDSPSTIFSPVWVSRRGVLRGAASSALIGASINPLHRAMAQSQALAYLAFGSAVLDILTKAVQLYKTVVGSGEVQNKTDTPQYRPLLVAIVNDRGLIERQAYQVVNVAPGQAVLVRVSANVGHQPGGKILRAQTAIDAAEGDFEVIESDEDN